ncbi:MAG: hypothetical protein WA159_25525 [Variovorax sp.]
MLTDYSKGRYNVMGPDKKQVGRIDEDEFVRSGTGLVCRIDGDEVYAIDGKYLGFIDSGTARSPKGDLLFTIVPE